MLRADAAQIIEGRAIAREQQMIAIVDRHADRGVVIRTAATAGERRGEALFNGKGQCARCHQAPYYTDNSMHDLKAERFYKQELSNGMMMAHDGPIKTFPLRGIKDSPPYLHDGRCFTLEDTVEYFNLVLQVRLSADEKKDLVAFLRTL